MDKPNRLLIVWSSADRRVALSNAFMYARASARNGWWDTIRFVIWGPSAHLLTFDQELQAGINELQDNGVHVMACRACSDMYAASEKLEALGVEVIYIGETFTHMLQDGWTCLTY